VKKGGPWGRTLPRGKPEHEKKDRKNRKIIKPGGFPKKKIQLGAGPLLDNGEYGVQGGT